MTNPEFQASANVQGRQFADQCSVLLEGLDFVTGPTAADSDEVGVEIDCVAESSPRQHDLVRVQGQHPGATAWA